MNGRVAQLPGPRRAARARGGCRPRRAARPRPGWPAPGGSRRRAGPAGPRTPRRGTRRAPRRPTGIRRLQQTLRTSMPSASARTRGRASSSTPPAMRAPDHQHRRPGRRAGRTRRSRSSQQHGDTTKSTTNDRGGATQAAINTLRGRSTTGVTASTESALPRRPAGRAARVRCCSAARQASAPLSSALPVRRSGPRPARGCRW